MTLALYCSLGACTKCGARRCSCTCHGGSTPPPEPAQRARGAELNCPHCGERAVDNSALANHQRSCPKRDERAPEKETPMADHKCRYCSNTSPNAQGRAAHERWCKNNPDRQTTGTPRARANTAVVAVVDPPPPAPDLAITVDGDITVTISGSASRILELLRALDT